MCQRKQYSLSFRHAIEEISTLTDFQKILITHRYILLVKDYERRCFLLSIYFHVSHIIVTVGSLIVPALLSIQYTDTSSTTSSAWDSQEFSYQIYWATWVISLMVTIANGILALLKIDKKYYFLHTTLEHLRSEGWQYLELSGRYSGFYTPHEAPTHNNQFIYFCHIIEKIKMKQVEEEYYKLNESQAPVAGATARAPLQQDALQNQAQNQNQASTIIPIQQAEVRPIQNTVLTSNTLVPDGLIPPTPLNPLLQKLLNTISGEKVSKAEIGGDDSELQNEKPNGGKQQSNGGKQQSNGGKQSETKHASEDTKMSMRSELPESSAPKNLILRSTSEVVPTSESNDRVGTEVSTLKME
jgi:hypothetical protein